MDSKKSIFLKVVMVLYILGFYLVEWSLAKIRPLKSKRPEVLAANIKYDAFSRNDLSKMGWKYRLLYWAVSPVMFIRYTIIWTSLSLMTALIWSLSIFSGTKVGEPYTGWRAVAMKKGIWLLAKVMMFSIGGYDSPKLKKVHADYSKWLGPDWKPDFVGPPSTVITPHSSFMDIFCNMIRQTPSHVAKKETLNIPLVGSHAAACGCLFVDRGDTDASNSYGTEIKNEMKKFEIVDGKGMLGKIVERQKLCE